jgi:hypothetical protein
VVAMQHVISDATSLKNFEREFLFYYNNFRDNKVVDSRALRFQLKDFAIWENNYLSGLRGEKSQSYWINELKDVENFEVLPAWKSTRFRFLGKNVNGGQYTAFVDEPLLRKIKSFAGAHQTSKLCIFYMALCCLLYRLSKRDNLIIIVPISLRDRKDLNELIGYLNTDVYLKFSLEDDLTVAKMVDRASAKYFEALDHRYHRMAELQKKSHECCAAVLNELPPNPDRIDNFTPRFITKDNENKARFPFFFMLSEYQNGLRIDCTYSNQVVNGRKIPAILDEYIRLLEVIASNDSIRVADLLDRSELTTR